ncbi:hypothetical protein predicted by Glimmer/Critica [Corynebacterium glutamicum ATCC 13032]|nr:hypothetical protein predicted by Glimmer/Critica [Corynebacterium glutamicum ATCC 13032]
MLDSEEESSLLEHALSANAAATVKVTAVALKSFTMKMILCSNLWSPNIYQHSTATHSMEPTMDDLVPHPHTKCTQFRLSAQFRRAPSACDLGVRRFQ